MIEGTLDHTFAHIVFPVVFHILTLQSYLEFLAYGVLGFFLFVFYASAALIVGNPGFYFYERIMKHLHVFL